ncbi:universal stress protein [Natronorarus salvus]|uniref:universal stress protein n=1 Tax=Natronorarus salvus TaxID=3117733 RepID=UPI002F26CF7D
MTILAAVDGSEHSSSVIEVGYDLAVTYGVPLEVLHVAPREEFKSYQRSLKGTDEFSDYSVRQHEDSAANVVRTLVRTTLDGRDRSSVSSVGKVGDPVEEILKHAEDSDARFVVIGGRKRSPTGKAIFGSVTQSVLLESDCPTVTVMSDEEG